MIDKIRKKTVSIQSILRSCSTTLCFSLLPVSTSGGLADNFSASNRKCNSTAGTAIRLAQACESIAFDIRCRQGRYIDGQSRSQAIKTSARLAGQLVLALTSCDDHRPAGTTVRRWTTACSGDIQSPEPSRASQAISLRPLKSISGRDRQRRGSEAESRRIKMPTSDLCLRCSIVSISLNCCLVNDL